MYKVLGWFGWGMVCLLLGGGVGAYGVVLSPRILNMSVVLVAIFGLSFCAYHMHVSDVIIYM